MITCILNFTAENYGLEATEDDGFVYNRMYIYAENYDPINTTDDGSCALTL